MPSIKAVLFDLDGVVRRFLPAHAVEIERRHRLDTDAIAAVAFEPGLLEAVTTGTITRDAWIERIGAALGNRDAAAEWGRQPFTVDDEVLALADELRARGLVTAVLTNGTDTISTEVSAMGLHAHFDAVYNSAEIGRRKPDSEAFQHVLRALGHEPEEVFFTDDSSDNVAGARALGMPSHRFTAIDDLRESLRAAGVLD
ncbi:HAD family hydrolase [Microbacterium sp. NPDC055903]